MGLDNGIDIYFERIPADIEEVKRRLNPSIYHCTDDNNTIPGEIWEMCYMRKWWGVRNEFVWYLTSKYDSGRDTYDWALDIDDLEKLKEIYADFDDKTKWEEDGDSIWDYEDDCIHEQIINHIEEVDRLINLSLDFQEDVILTFYDSY